MTKYWKKAQEVLESVEKAVTGAGKAAVEKVAPASTGNDGGVGKAKTAISTRRQRLDAEEAKAN